MPKRRSPGDGAIFQMHDHETCPPAIDGEPDKNGKVRKTRLPHTCQGTWIVRVEVDGKRRQVKVKGRRADALVRLKAMIAERDAGIHSGRLTTGEWLTYWLAEVEPYKVRDGHLLRESSLARSRSAIDTWLIPQLGKVPLDKLGPEHVRALMRALDQHHGRGGKPLADGSKKRVHSVLRAALEDAMKDGKIATNPAARISVPTGRAHYAALSADEARQVIDCTTDPRMRARLAVAFLGLRQGEALGLTWDDIHDGVLDVRRQIRRLKGQGLVPVPLKTAASERDVPMPPAFASLVETWRTHGTGEGYVFPGVSGGPEDYRRDYGAWIAALDAAGVRRVPLHGARATAATILEGQSLRVVADLLGHDPAMTARIYQRRDAAQIREAAEGLGVLLP